MVSTAYVIKRFVKLDVEYMPEEYAENRDRWEDTPYGARKFDSKEAAENYLIDSFEKKHWGGIFEVVKIFISR